MPLTFIGDMPRLLMSCSEWRALKVNEIDIQCGDLLFVRNKQKIKLLSHVALVLEVDKIFHCSPIFGTAVIETSNQFFSLYEQKLNFKQMIAYIDPRNKQLKEEKKLL